MLLTRFRPVRGPSARVLIVAGLVAAGLLHAEERPVDPTFLVRRLPEAPFMTDRFCLNRCQYRPLFGDGDSLPEALGGIARFGQLQLEPLGSTGSLHFPNEEHVYFVLEGSGSLHFGETRLPLEGGDVAYLPPGVSHRFEARDSDPLEFVMMGYRIPAGLAFQGAREPQKANLAQADPQVLAGHPPSTRYRLLLGDVTSTRDLLATAQEITSLFLMEFDPGGTNHPHHHLMEEEIYLLLEGSGQMVAGGGMDGVEGRHPAHAGDAYYVRPNCTVGFYADPDPSSGPARILAIRSRHPAFVK